MPYRELTKATPQNNREEWLSFLNKGIGASEFPAALGVSKFKTMAQLWAEKTGALEREDISEKAAVQLGIRGEAMAAGWYCDMTGNEIYQVHRTLVHKDIPWWIVNPDRMVVGQERGLEVKTSLFGDGYGDEGTDQVPDDVRIQCQSYMEVLDREVWDVAACIWSKGLQLYIVNRDEELIAMMREGGQRFMDFIATNTQPPVDHEHSTAIELLKKLYPGTNGQVVDLGENLFEAHQQMKEANKVKTTADKKAKALKAQILDAMGEASVGVFPDGSGFTRKLTTRKGYTVEDKSYIDARFTKKAA